MWCWWCCHPIEGEPLNLPYKYDEKCRTFHTMGYFCSWPCMKSYNLETNNYKMYEVQQNITFMRKLVYGQTTALRCAPKRQALKVFGGTMSIEDFRANKDPPAVYVPTSVFHSSILTSEVEKPSTGTESKTFSSAEHKLRTIHESTAQGEQLKIKRTKPLKRTESPLEKSLNLKRNR